MKNGLYFLFMNDITAFLYICIQLNEQNKTLQLLRKLFYWVAPTNDQYVDPVRHWWGKTAIKNYLEKRPSDNNRKQYNFASFYLWLLTLYHYRALDVFFEEDICHLWSYYSRIGFDYSKSLKSLYEDLWSPFIFKKSKFSKTVIKILKRFLKFFSLFISVK